jgi:hypothetical protein
MPTHDRGAEICIERDHRRGYRQNYKTITDEPMKDAGVSVRAVLRCASACLNTSVSRVSG